MKEVVKLVKIYCKSILRHIEINKGIHSDFLTVEEAMTYAFSTIENNQAWDLMPSLVLELALCFHMLQ